MLFANFGSELNFSRSLFSRAEKDRERKGFQPLWDCNRPTWAIFETR